MYNDMFNKKVVEQEQSGIHLLDSDIKVPKFKGEIFDELIDAKTGKVIATYHGFNTVVDSCSKLIAALIKRHAGVQGALFWEVGSGSGAWNDSSPPAPATSDVALVAPFFRKAINTGDIAFIDGSNNVTATITNRIQITISFGTDEANGYLREFGIYGGDATCTVGAFGSGIMVNRKTHGVIYKTSGMVLNRTLRLTF